MIEDTAVVARAAEPMTAVVDAETVMLDPAKGAYYALGAIGTRIWQLLEQPIAVAELYATLMGEFDVDADTCRRDVDAFLDQLREANLVEVRTS